MLLPVCACLLYLSSTSPLRKLDHFRQVPSIILRIATSFLLEGPGFKQKSCLSSKRGLKSKHSDEISSQFRQVVIEISVNEVICDQK